MPESAVLGRWKQTLKIILCYLTSAGDQPGSLKTISETTPKRARRKKMLTRPLPIPSPIAQTEQPRKLLPSQGTSKYGQKVSYYP